ncbi:hypothetical protein VNO78_23679 [Psophocarpus tetragonolobus]|uniref:Peptidase S54 rhomboid domain-containing protein n=1 Tax=Psophocarpus tetragonolobus TaxID=3891 RepID=A0AAN9S4K4_PSOTE
MQGLIRKVVAKTQQLPHSHTNPHRIFNTYSGAYAESIFSSVTKPQPHIPSSSSSFTTHFYSCRSFSTNLRAFVSQPIISRLFAFNSLLRPTLHYFRRHHFNFTDNPHFSRSWLGGLTSNDVVLGLIIANVAIFLLWRIANEKFMIQNFTISLDNFMSGRLHTLITNAFSHVDTWHIVSNMIGLYFFGMNIGRNFGSDFLLKLYLAGAIGGSAFYLMHQAYKAQTSKDWRAMIASKELAMGASGAVNAIMLLDIFLFPKATLYLDFFIPVPAVLLGIFLIGKDMLRIIEGNSQISGSAHLGGAAVAAIAWASVRKGRL